MTPQINWNYLPQQNSYTMNYPAQSTFTTTSAPIWTSTVTSSADMFQTTQSGTAKSAQELYNLMQKNANSLEKAQNTYNEVLAQKQKMEEMVKQIKETISLERFTDTSKLQQELARAEKELTFLNNQLPTLQGNIKRAQTNLNKAVQSYEAVSPAVRQTVGNVQQAITNAAPVIDNAPVPAERALVPFRPAQTQALTTVKPAVVNSEVVEEAASIKGSLKPGRINPNIGEIAAFEEVVNKPTPVVPGKAPFKAAPKPEGNLNIKGLFGPYKPNTLPQGQLDIVGMHGMSPNNVVSLNSGLAEMPQAAEVAKERSWFGRLFDRLFGSRETKIANAQKRISGARKDANEAYKLMKDSRQKLVDAKTNFANLGEVGASPEGIPKKRIALIEEGLANGKFNIEDFKASDPEIYNYFKNKDNYAKCLADVKKSGLEYAQKNGEYINKLNDVKKAQNKLSRFQRGTEAQKLTEGAIGRTEKRISRATDKATGLLDGVLENKEMKQALGKKGIGKGGKIAIAVGAVALVGLGIAALCGAFKKKDKEEQPVTEQPVTEQPVTEQPVVEEHVADTVEQPVAAEEPVVEQPVVEQPVVEQPAAPAEKEQVPSTPSDRFNYNPGGDFIVEYKDSMWKIVRGLYEKKDPNFTSLPQKEQDRKIIYGIRKMVAANGLKYKAKDDRNPRYYVPIYPGQKLIQVELD